MNPYYYIEHRSLLFVQKRAVIPVNLAKLMYISHNNILWYYTGVSILHWNVFPGFQSTIQYVNTGSNNRLTPNRHLTRCVARYYRVPTYIAKTLGSTSIRYRSYTFASGLIDIDPRVFAIWVQWLHWVFHQYIRVVCFSLNSPIYARVYKRHSSTRGVGAQTSIYHVGISSGTQHALKEFRICFD